jgi:hypothetical protein
LPGFDFNLGDLDIDPSSTTSKDIKCDAYWNQLFPGHPTGSGPFIPTGADLSALNIYSKKCPVDYKYHVCCGRGLHIQGPVNGELCSGANFKFDVGNKPKDCEYNFWANKGWMWSDGRYTAPETSVEIEDTMGVYPWTGVSGSVDTNCKTWKVKIKPKTGDCKGRVTVTAPTMAVGASQTLTVQGWVAGEVYSWSTTTGSLDVATGNSVVYTAPASNANCASNPTITLSCGGSVVQTIEIAVNTGGTGYGYLCEITNIGSCRYAYYPPGVLHSIYWEGFYMKRWAVQCNGTVALSGTAGPLSGWCYMSSGNCSCEAAYSLMLWHTGDCYCITEAAFTSSWGDCRTPAEKNAGCCPQQLMSNTRACRYC